MMATSHPRPASLLAYFERVFRSTVSRPSRQSYQSAVRRLVEFRGYDPRLAKINESMLFRFRRWCLAKNTCPGEKTFSPATVGKYESRIKTICRRAIPGSFPKNSQLKEQPKRRRNSLMTFLERVYIPEHVTTKVGHYNYAIKKFNTFAGRDVTIEEVTPALVAEFLDWGQSHLAGQTSRG